MMTIIDYGVGNIGAFQNVYKRLNISTKIAKSHNELVDVDKLILPGVGSFDHAMKQLNNSGMREKLEELVIFDKVPVLGICVGMQMMGNRSEEGGFEGLKWIDAEILKFDEAVIPYRTKTPHMGWNHVIPERDNLLFAGLTNDPLFYFLHSYYFKCNNTLNTIAHTIYGNSFSSAVQCDNIYGIQFHPEKSHQVGEKLLYNFAKL